MSSDPSPPGAGLNVAEPYIPFGPTETIRGWILFRKELSRRSKRCGSSPQLDPSHLQVREVLREQENGQAEAAEPGRTSGSGPRGDSSSRVGRCAVFTNTLPSSRARASRCGSVQAV